MEYNKENVRFVECIETDNPLRQGPVPAASWIPTIPELPALRLLR
ncbi:MAG TPA: hypothetical protein VJN63_09080 [Thermoplasmata archaeon]|nr:hypothetical protein [Thermoplasmata archaeon]